MELKIFGKMVKFNLIYMPTTNGNNNKILGRVGHTTHMTERYDSILFIILYILKILCIFWSNQFAFLVKIIRMKLVLKFNFIWIPRHVKIFFSFSKEFDPLE